MLLCKAVNLIQKENDKRLTGIMLKHWVFIFIYACFKQPQPIWTGGGGGRDTDEEEEEKR